MKNNIIKIAIVCVSILFVGCEDRLNLTDPSVLGLNQFIVDEETAELALFGMYDNLQSRYVAGAEPKMVQGLYADELEHPGSFPHLDEALFNNFLTNNFAMTNIMASHYNAINSSVEIARLTEDLEDNVISPSRRSEIVAEAHAVRAFAYFQMVKTYGGLPIPTGTVPLDGPEAGNVPRSSESEVYEYILNEINLAQGKLASNNPVTQMTENALTLLKADVYMFRGQYDLAEPLLASLVGDYSITGTYEELWDGSSNSSAIFRVAYNAVDANGLSAFFTPTGRREVSPSQKLVDAFEPGDTRINLIVNPSNPLTNFINKYQSTFFQPYIYRYADVLLMYGEVLARRNAPNAASVVDPVRTRAGLGTIAPLNSSNVVSKIAQERFVEFYGEGRRWQDVKRLGLAQQVITSKGLNFTARQLLWPIPQNEIDRNASLSQADQNPGY
ncbi:RagB/SusD family nutrient uptake outer membrane protein [Jejudonia soesokkakensis]|uniref:RagB/SusD family nutrient uptake outer membrane protein n=1 Tax=Jejudonia soesokkakensis TaxID=1323432 RepID=A0ABW2MWJ8_9FLAO